MCTRSVLPQASNIQHIHSSSVCYSMHPRRYQSSLPLSVSPYAMRFDRSLPLCIVAFKSPSSPSFISYSSRLLYLSQILRSQPFIIPFSSSNHPILSSARIFFGSFKLFVSTFPPYILSRQCCYLPSPVVSIVSFSLSPDHYTLCKNA